MIKIIISLYIVIVCLSVVMATLTLLNVIKRKKIRA